MILYIIRNKTFVIDFFLFRNLIIKFTKKTIICIPIWVLNPRQKNSLQKFLYQIAQFLSSQPFYHWNNNNRMFPKTLNELIRFLRMVSLYNDFYFFNIIHTNFS